MPHLAIVDINMPGMNGFQFCEAVQQFSDLPVILLSAVDAEETIIQGSAALPRTISQSRLASRAGRGASNGCCVELVISATLWIW